MAAGGGTGNVGTHYEQLIAKLMESDGDPSKCEAFKWKYWGGKINYLGNSFMKFFIKEKRVTIKWQKYWDSELPAD